MSTQTTLKYVTEEQLEKVCQEFLSLPPGGRKEYVNIIKKMMDVNQTMTNNFLILINIEN